MAIVWLMIIFFSLSPLIAHVYVEDISLLNYAIFVFSLFCWLVISLFTYFKLIASRESIPNRNLYILILSPLLILNLSATYSLKISVSDEIEVDQAVQAFESDLFYLKEFEPDTVTFSGSIGLKTLDSFNSIINLANIKRVVIDDSPGGLIGIALELAKIFEEQELEVVVTKNCLSSCVIMATSGDVLLTTKESFFGFHSSSEVGDISERSAYLRVIEGNKLVSQALEKNGFSEEILSKISTTSSDSMYYITGFQLIDEGLAELYVK